MRNEDVESTRRREKRELGLAESDSREGILVELERQRLERTKKQHRAVLALGRAEWSADMEAELFWPLRSPRFSK